MRRKNIISQYIAFNCSVFKHVFLFFITLGTSSVGKVDDSKYIFRHHIKNTVKMCNYFIRDIRHVQKHLSLDASTVLANAPVGSRLDYCNSLLHSIPKVYLDKLQPIQNSLARVVTKSTRFTSSKLLLKRFH